MTQAAQTIYKYLSPEQVAQAKEQSTLLDVRSPIEFESEHIEGALNIPLQELEGRLEDIPRGKDLVMICRSGKRAERGAYALMCKGMEPKVMTGGVLAWQKAGLKLVEGKKMLPIERQIQLIVGVGVLTGVLLGAFVNPWFLILPGFFGAGLTFAGLSGTCALGLLLIKAPWNQLPGECSSSDSSNKPKGGCCP
ncbi:MAG: rhodanese-like domain-containing protein [Cyanobacteria bacterium TGS_CYA1]|nr:rhodanese-like domain-containing protein [Cyanobacteria bacterium TGS_CYA1]